MTFPQSASLSAVVQLLPGDSLHRIVVDFYRLIAPKWVQPWISVRTPNGFPICLKSSVSPLCTAGRRKLGLAGRKSAAGSHSGIGFSERKHEALEAAA